MGIFRDIEREDYGAAMTAQHEAAQKKNGHGDLNKLFRSQATWQV